MAKLFLHVGMPKTGTSFIQGFVNVNSKIIKEISGMEFLCNHHPHELACHLISDESLRGRADIAGLLASDFEILAKELGRIKEMGLNCFFSSEYFVLCEKQDVVSFFKRYFDDIEIIYTVRRQDKLLASGYNQDVKALGRTSDLSWSYVSAKTMRYLENCIEWEKLGCSIKVINYDAVKKEVRGLEKAVFSIFMNVNKLFNSAIKTPPSDASNFSLSKNQVLLKLYENRSGESLGNILQELSDSDIKKEEFSLPSEYRNLIASCYCDDNKKLASKYMSDSVSNSMLFESTVGNTDLDDYFFSWDPLAETYFLIEFLLKKIKLLNP